jgi:hypothetical protein
MGMLPAGQGTVGFLWRYFHAMPYHPGWGDGVQAMLGASDVSLVYQPERGGRWFPIPGRPTFIDRMALPWSHGWVNTASNVVQVGDEQRLYYSGRPHPHGMGMDMTSGKKHGPDRGRGLEDAGITYASWPAWRLFGLRTDHLGGIKLRLGAITRPSQVVLNYTIDRPDGHVLPRLSADGHADRPADEALPLAGSAVAAPVAWRSTGATLPITPKAELHLDLRFATIYAFEVRPLE